MTGAVVLARSAGARTVVGGLPLAARTALALTRAGVEDVTVVAGARPGLIAETLARRPATEQVRCLGGPDFGALRFADTVLVLAGDVLVDEDALARLRVPVRPGTFRQAGVTTQTGGEPRALLCPGAGLAVGLAALAGRPEREPTVAGLAEALRGIGLAEDAAAPVDAGLFVPLDAGESPRGLEARLLDHLARHTRVGDSYLAALIDQRLARPVTRWLLPLPVTPSQITLASIVVGLAGAAGLASVSYAGRIAGVLALIVSIVLDCVDGEVARARYEQSAAGARLDVTGDYVVNLATFLGLGLGLSRQGLPPAGLWAVLLLVGGVATAMATMHRFFVQPSLTRGRDLHWAGDAGSLRGTPFAEVVEKLASRDYTYLLLLGALAGHLEWFLYAAAGGSWLFVLAVVWCWAYRRFGRVGAEVLR